MSRVDDLDVVIRHKGGKVVAGIPQIGLYATGADVNAALAALNARKESFVADLEDAGELGMLEVESSRIDLRRGTARPVDDLRYFAMKAGIVVCVIVVGLVVSSLLIVSKIENAIENTTNQVKNIKVGGPQFWSKIEADIDRMARSDSDLPKAKKQKLLADIHAIAAKWRPFVVELESALTDTRSQPPQSGGPAAK